MQYVLNIGNEFIRIDVQSYIINSRVHGDIYKEGGIKLTAQQTHTNTLIPNKLSEYSLNATTLPAEKVTIQGHVIKTRSNV